MGIVNLIKKNKSILYRVIILLSHYILNFFGIYTIIISLPNCVYNLCDSIFSLIDNEKSSIGEKSLMDEKLYYKAANIIIRFVLIKLLYNVLTLYLFGKMYDDNILSLSLTLLLEGKFGLGDDIKEHFEQRLEKNNEDDIEEKKIL